MASQEIRQSNVLRSLEGTLPEMLAEKRKDIFEGGLASSLSSSAPRPLGKRKITGWKPVPRKKQDRSPFALKKQLETFCHSFLPLPALTV